MKKLGFIVPALAFAFVLGTADAEAGYDRYGRYDRGGDSKTIEINTTNKAKIDNKVDAWANSGNNVASRNKGDVEIHTGDATAVNFVTNHANETKIDVYDSCDCDGKYGRKHRYSRKINRIDIDSKNDADVDNDVFSDSNTGHNTANNNGGKKGKKHYGYDYDYGYDDGYDDGYGDGGDGYDYYTRRHRGGDTNIHTGTAGSQNEVTTVVNSQVVRVTRE